MNCWMLLAACITRKDYQFNEILVPMRLAHGPNPQGTLSRIEEQLVLAHQLEEAARSKTTAIAIEELISFAAEESPSLSLEMLHREERMIFREARHQIARASPTRGQDDQSKTRLVPLLRR